MDTSITEERWGGYRALRLSSTSISALAVPDVGGRVVSLVDRGPGREWLLQGSPPHDGELHDWSSDAVVFSGRESFGWDECLPTVSVCPDPTDADSRPLRDHGDQWARPAATTIDADGPAITSVWASPAWPYRLSRRLSMPAGDSLLAEYSLTSHGEARLPLLWSMHPVIELEKGTSIEVPGADHVRATWTEGVGFDDPERVAWPLARLTDGSDLDLSSPPSAASWAAKLYGAAPGPVTVRRADGAALEFDWDRAFAPAVGIWLSCGGWPEPAAPVEQMAIEPTTSMDDDLVGALEHERARYLPPGGTLSWWVRLTLSH